MGLTLRELCPQAPGTGDFGPPLDSRPWFALAVKPQHEAIVQDILLAKGIQAYTPVYWTTRRWSDRLKRLQAPLFPGYVFCSLHTSSRAEAVKTAGVRSIVCFGGEPAPISHQQIANLQKMIASEYGIEPLPFTRTGQRVRIGEGALAGLEGVLAQHRNQSRVVVNLHLLQRSVAVEIDPASLIPLD